jgi:hypothetical protein
VTLILFSPVGLLDARSLGNYTERCRIKCEMKAPRPKRCWRGNDALAVAGLFCSASVQHGSSTVLRQPSFCVKKESVMKAWSIIGLLFAAAIFATIPISPQVTPRGVELSADQAQAITYGRYRRVHRRAYRRAYRSAYYWGAPSYYYGARSYYAPSYYYGGYYGRRFWW